MNARHDIGYYTHACLKCGLTAEQLQAGSSPWCDYLEHTPSGNSWRMWVHVWAILLLVAAPIYGLLPVPLTAMLCVAGAIFIAQVHAGLWDWLTGETE